VLVLTGAGPVFCSGADLKESRARNAEGAAAAGPGAMVAVFRALAEGPKPVVARVNGPARAGGLGLIGVADIAIAADSATFGFAEVRVGVVPAVISVPLLPLLDPRAARELLLTGEPFDATRAVAIGLLTRAVPAAGLDDEVARTVGLLRQGAPQALRATRALLRRSGPPAPDAEAYAAMLTLSERHFASAEAHEGMTAFAEKRPPAWAPPQAHS
jgi:methylglutaconyl-CoA hydratase